MYTIENTSLGDLYELGLGSMKAEGENGWNMEKTFSIFDTYFDNGGNMFDTARVYSAFSKSEEYIGQWSKSNGKRHDIIITSKGGHPDITAECVDMHKSRLTKSDMVYDLETSLKALCTDYIDIYLYHRDDVSIPVSELLGIMEEFVKQGKIRYYGCSNWTLPRIKEANEYAKAHGLRGFVMNQAMLSAASDHAAPNADDTLVRLTPEVREYHKTHPEMIAVAYSGIALGFFSQYLRGGEAAVKDKSYCTPYNFELAKKMEKSAKEKGITLLQETLHYFKTLDINVIPLFTPRDEASLLEAMQVFSR